MKLNRNGKRTLQRRSVASHSASRGGSVQSDLAPTEDCEELRNWLGDFESKHGRPLRVLHVGNIANNAYLNAKFLRSVGVDAHVLSYDNLHVMAMPEWEDIEVLRGHGDDFLPRFSKRDLHGYRRPPWFVSGPLLVCVPEISRLCGERLSPKRRVEMFLLGPIVGSVTKLVGPLAGQGVQLLIAQPKLGIYKIWGYLRSAGGPDHPLLNVIARIFHALRRFLSRGRGRTDRTDDYRRVIDAYDEAFSQRPDRLRLEEIMLHQPMIDRFQDMFRHYDVVQCYATEPIHALLAGKHPYVAFEHGTLRHFTMDDDPLHRLTALAYRLADHALITNGDCLAYAEKLGIPAYSPIVHPVDVEQHRQDFGDAIGELRREIDADVILFCPVRHDWQIKGTDVHLRALPLLKSHINGRVKLVLVRWGAQLAESEALLESLGCAEDVVWRTSMCRITMIKHIRAADVVLDQMALPHFGATAPQAIAAGTPVISSYSPESTSWIIPEPAPILPAFSPAEVAGAVAKALDPDWRAEYVKRARGWTDKYHHPDNVIHDHLRIYREILTHDR